MRNKDEFRKLLVNFLLWLRAEDERIAEYSQWSSAEQLVDDYAKYLRSKRRGEHMEPYQERVVEEKAELDSKIERLVAFITGDTFTKLSPEDRDLLEDQCTAMQQYSKILKKRIERF